MGPFGAIQGIRTNVKIKPFGVAPLPDITAILAAHLAHLPPPISPAPTPLYPQNPNPVDTRRKGPGPMGPRPTCSFCGRRGHVWCFLNTFFCQGMQKGEKRVPIQCPRFQGAPEKMRVFVGTAPLMKGRCPLRQLRHPRLPPIPWRPSGPWRCHRPPPPLNLYMFPLRPQIAQLRIADVAGIIRPDR